MPDMLLKPPGRLLSVEELRAAYLCIIKKHGKKAYIEKSKLKKPFRYHFRSSERRFKSNSLLCDCEDVEIREQNCFSKHNPVYGKK